VDIYSRGCRPGRKRRMLMRPTQFRSLKQHNGSFKRAVERLPGLGWTRNPPTPPPRRPLHHAPPPRPLLHIPTLDPARASCTPPPSVGASAVASKSTGALALAVYRASPVDWRWLSQGSWLLVWNDLCSFYGLNIRVSSLRKEGTRCSFNI
jgi:hypothetical protein